MVAILAARSKDIAAAEDMLSEALAEALTVWPDKGTPQKPEAWLLTVARRKAMNTRRAEDVSRRNLDTLILLSEEKSDALSGFPDKRLELMFACAHPAIDASIHTPLMLQTVLGLDAAAISRAFLVSTEAMSQRLVRAKAKIRDADIGFLLPDESALQPRLKAVLDAVYAAFGAGWESGAQAQDLTGEAVFLARLLSGFIPDEPEPKGLLAMILFCEARKQARFGRDGNFVPLREQNTALWSRDMVVEAENLLTLAARKNTFGRYQCEAAIQSVHVQRALTGTTNFSALLTLYGLLVAHADSVGARVGLAVVQLESGDVAAALVSLNEIDAAVAENYQPYWVTRAKVLSSTGAFDEARAAREKAVSLSCAPVVRVHVEASLMSPT